MTVTANVGVGPLSFGQADFVMTYSGSTETFIMDGDASVTLPEIGSIEVDFGGTTPNGTQTDGLVVVKGTLETLNMTVASNIDFEGLSFTITDCVIAYTTANGESLFTMTGDASVNIPLVGSSRRRFRRSRDRKESSWRTASLPPSTCRCTPISR